MKYSGPNNMAMIIPKKCDAKLPVLPTHTVAVIYASIPKNIQIRIRIIIVIIVFALTSLLLLVTIIIILLLYIQI